MAPTFTTNLGLIKPDPLDAIDVAQINANMDTLDTVIGTAQVLPAVPPSSGFCTAYPLGTSMVRMTAADLAADSGWVVEPGTSTAMVVTFKSFNDRAVQLWFRQSLTANLNAAWYRYITNVAVGPWSKWAGVDQLAVSTTASLAVPQATHTKATLTTALTTSVQNGPDITLVSGGLKLASGGIYRVDAVCTFDFVAAGGSRIMGIDVDGSGPSALNRVNVPSSTGEIAVGNLSLLRKFNAGDVVYIWVYQSATASGATVSARMLTAQRQSTS